MSFSKVRLLLCFIILVIVAVNIDRYILLTKSQTNWEYEYFEANITHNQFDHHVNNLSEQFETSSDQKQQSNHKVTIQQTGKLCISLSNKIDLKEYCVNTPFNNVNILNTNETQNYFIVDIKDHIVAVKKQGQQNGKYISRSKDQHTPSKETPTIYSIPNSDYFILQWSKLYTVYQVQEHSIVKRLFLQKTTNNYTQHWIKAEGQNVTLLSFPKKSQILLQVYNCQQQKVSFISKIPIDGWISNYKFKLNGQNLNIYLQTSNGDIINYVFDRSLSLSSQSNERKYEINHSIVQRDMQFKTTVPNDYFKIIQSLITTTYQHLKKRIAKQIQGISFPKSYSYYDLKFYIQNRLFKYQSIIDKFNIISFGKFMIPSQNSAFHNFENNTFNPNQDKQNIQPVYYLQNGIIKSEQYWSIFQVYPKYQAQWVGVSKNFIHFYPNKQKPGIRFAKTPDGIMVFEGLKIKGVWKEPIASEYYSYQYLNRKPQQLKNGFSQGHMFYTGLIAIIEIQQNLSSGIHFFSGFNGKKLYNFKLQGHDPENIVISIQNNDILISVYMPSQKQTQVIKIQFYSQGQKYSFLTIKRSYRIQNRVLNIKRYQNNYYFTISSEQNVYLCSSKLTQFNNRRPIKNTNEYSSFEAKMIINQLVQYSIDNVLEMRCVVIDQASVVQIGHSINQIYPLSHYIVLLIKQNNQQRFLSFDVVNLIDNKVKEIAHQIKINRSLIIIGTCLSLFLIIILLKQNKKQNNQKNQTSANPNPTSKTTKNKKKKQ